MVEVSSPRRLGAWQSTNVILLVFGVFLGLQIAVSAQIKPTRKVLIINEVGTSYPLINLVDEGIRTSLANSSYRIEFYREYMDTVLFPDPGDQRVVKDFYLRKYTNHKPDVIITVGSSPLRFMTETHRKFFSGVPVIYCYPNAPAEEGTFDPQFTGVDTSIAPASTVALALHLLPDTLHLVVVGGVAPFDKRQQPIIRDQLRPFEDHLDISYLTDLAAPVLVERLKNLPSHTIILMGALGRDAAGTSFNANEAGALVSSAANAPVFSLTDRHLNHGEVGGDVSSALEQGKIVGAMALHLLKGANPADIPILKSPTIYMFDWRALKRWGIKESALPPDSILLNRRPSFWELYKRYLLAGIFALLAQFIAIFALLWQRAQRRKTAAELKKSEEKFSKAFQRSPLVFTLASLADYRFIEVNHTFELLTGWTHDEVIGRTPSDIGLWVNLNERSNFIEQLRAYGVAKGMEFVFRKKNGQVWTGLVSSELIDINGEPCALSLTADITDRKMAEKSLAEVGRKLIQAHEEERTWIARELHDDINQQLALLAVGMEQFKQNLPESATGAVEQLNSLRYRICDIGKDVQGLSHRLHSSKLDYLGLPAAAKSFCKELSEQKKVEIEFTHSGVPHGAPKEVTLCLFRVLQEALQNAVKHSRVRHFKVELKGTPADIELTVTDFGAGFDPREVLKQQGLGLISMRERVQLVDGEFSITSQAGRGTIISARVPLQATWYRTTSAG
jgi:PAS domain S-box-containing protein